MNPNLVRSPNGRWKVISSRENELDPEAEERAANFQLAIRLCGRSDDGQLVIDLRDK